MGIVSRIGQWLDTRFPEKINADIVLLQVAELNGKIAALESQLVAFHDLYGRVTLLETKVVEQVSEMNKAKVAFMSMQRAPSAFPHR